MLMSDLCNWEDWWSSGWTEVERLFKLCKMFYWGGVGWGNCDEKSDPSCALQKKGLRIDLTKEEHHTELRKIYLDRSGPKLNKIQAQLESPTSALSTPEILIVAPKECGAAIYSKVVE